MKYKFEIDNSALNGFEIPAEPGFGVAKAPLMLSADLLKSDPIPEIVKIGKTQDLSLDPFCSTLHYGQSSFEGMKAYRTAKGEAVVFRARDGMERFARSAKLMKMLDLDVDFLMDCLMTYLKEVKDCIPTTKGHALYLRPLLFANDPMIKVKSGDIYKFLIMSSPVGDYFATAKTKTKVLISDQYVRALPGGTGEAKTAANYAQSLPALHYAQSLGYQQVVYVDALTRLFIEELGGMNFFWVEEGTLCTPPLTGTILRGITRKTILEIAKDIGIEVSERKIAVKELRDKVHSGKISEVFASGTAAVMNPLNEIGIQVDGEEISTLTFDEFPVMDRLKTILLATQRGESEFSDRYLTKI